MSTLPVRSGQDLNNFWPLLNPHRKKEPSHCRALHLQEQKVKSEFWGLLFQKHSHLQEMKLKGPKAIDIVCFGIMSERRAQDPKQEASQWHLRGHTNQGRDPGHTESESRFREHRPESWKNDTSGPPVNLGQPTLYGEWRLIKSVSSPYPWLLSQSFRNPGNFLSFGCWLCYANEVIAGRILDSFRSVVGHQEDQPCE